MSKGKKQGGSTRPQHNPQQLRRQGAAYFRKGDLDFAIACWRRLSDKERDPALTAALAEAHFRRGKLSDLEQAAALAPGDSRIVFHLGRTYHRLGKWEEAEARYRQVLGDPVYGPRAAYTIALHTISHRPLAQNDPAVWQRLSPEGRARLQWVRQILRGSAPDVPAPEPVWPFLLGAQQHLAARHKSAAGVPPLPVPPDLENWPPLAAAAADYYLGVDAWAAGDPETAYAHWLTAADAGMQIPSLSTNLTAAAYTLATARLEAGDAAGAVTVVEPYLAVGGNEDALRELAAHAYFLLGNAEAMAGRWQEAEAHWLRVEQVEPRNGRSRRLVINLALAAEQMEQWESAADLWREALRRRPRRDDHPDALDDAQVARLWQHVAENYRRAGWMDEVLVTYRNAIKWAPDNLDLRAAYLDALLEDGRFEAANNEAERVLAAHPGHVPILERLAVAQENFGYWRWGFNSAVQTWKQILEIQPEHENARRALARIHREEGDYWWKWGDLRQAVDSYRQALAYTPQQGELLVMIAVGEYVLGKKKQALEHLRAAYDVDPKNLGMYNMAVRYLIDWKQWEEAERTLDLALERVPDAPPDFAVGLYAYALKANPQSWGQKRMDEAVERYAGEPEVLAQIGVYLGHAGFEDRAVALLKRALELDPDLIDANLLIGRYEFDRGNKKEAQRYFDAAERAAKAIGVPQALYMVQMLRAVMENNPMRFMEVAMQAGGIPQGFPLPPGFLYGAMGDGPFAGLNPFLDDDEDDDDDWYDDDEDEDFYFPSF